MSYYERRIASSNIYRYLRIPLKNSSILTQIYGIFFPKNIFKKNFTSKTQLIIDGPPRCANHYVYEYLYNQFTDIEIAHHYHAPGLPKLALNKSIPTIIVIRDPREQLQSSAVYFEKIKVKILLAELHHYYKEILKMKNYIISDFDRSTMDPFSIVRELFHKYSEKLPKFEPKEFSDEFIFNKIKIRKKELNAFQMKSPIPSNTKNKEKTKYTAEIEDNLDTKVGRLLLENYQILKSISDENWRKFKS